METFDVDLLLDGNDWLACPLVPNEWVNRQIWRTEWTPNAWPPAGNWLTATVPGDVIADALDAGLIPDPYVDMNSRCCEWLAQRDWVYRKYFDVPAEWQGKTVRLKFGGVDYACSVYVNGEELIRHEGTFAPFEIDVSKKLLYGEKNQVTVLLKHAPEVELVQGQIGWTCDARIWKPRFAYSWDWCTRLIPIGIWQSVRLVATDRVAITDVWVRPTVHGDSATINTQISVKWFDGPHPTRAIVTVIDPNGVEIACEQKHVEPGTDTVDFAVPVDSPELWWPNGMGAQPLYTVQVNLGDDARAFDSRTVRTGIRVIRQVRNEGSSDTALPYTLEVNGQKMFVKGWNWVPIDHMYGRKQTDRYAHWLRMAQRAHCNLMRVWGGGLLEREEFYELCDELGILVWQEFNNSSSGAQNSPAIDGAYLSYTESQARLMIPQRRNHASLAIWCGGNELMSQPGKPLDDYHPALRLLKSLVEELDPGRAWLPTSSSGPVFSPAVELLGTGKMHDVHGPWQYNDLVEYYRLYNANDCLYHSEFGAEGAANMALIERYVSKQYHWPADGTNPAWVHHGSWWINQERLEQWFGKFEDVESYVRASQWIQCEGLRYAIDSARRRKWQSSGVSPWQFNEAFPNTSCTNALDYLGAPKPAYWWIRRSYAPVHVSLKYDKLSWKHGDSWSAQPFVNNSGPALPDSRWTLRIENLLGEPQQSFQATCDLPANGAVALDPITWQFPEEGAEAWMMFTEVSDAQGNVLAQNEYVFSTTEVPLAPLMNLPPTTIDVQQDGRSVTITNSGRAVAFMVQLIPEDWSDFFVSDNCFSLTPGEKRVLYITGDSGAKVKGWNTNTAELHPREGQAK